MTPAELIASAMEDGLLLRLTETGTIAAKGDPNIVAQWAPILKLRKGEIIASLQLDLDLNQRRAKVLAMLQANQEIRHAIAVFDEFDDSVIVSIAIRDIASCELTIPRSRYDALKLLELIEKRMPIVDLSDHASA